jgi:glycosyltransferase involved in cell wall biosynthesis
MKLLIVIPAFNEEASIAEVIRRTLEARAELLSRTALSAVNITVVSDGSTDRTVERAAAFGPSIDLIIFERNRGYGAAIMESWRRSDAELLGFLDADGTCDPRFFVELCQAVLERGADMALGSRLHPLSRMPWGRRVGNVVFALMLTVLGSTRVRDSASGMRVIRRDRLPRLMPLPDGLHFTPALSARAILAGDLRVVEVEMPYNERTGQSKLRPFRHAWPFSRVILSAAILYRPSRPLGLLALVAFTSALAWSIRLAWQYYRFGAFELWMIYHFVVIQLSTTAGVLLLTAGYLGRKAVGITLSDDVARWRSRGPVGAVLSHRAFWFMPLALIVAGSLAVAPAAIDRIHTGSIDPAAHHWSRFFAMSFAYSVAFILSAARLLDITLDLLGERVMFLRHGRTTPSTESTSAGSGGPGR